MLLFILATGLGEGKDVIISKYMLNKRIDERVNCVVTFSFLW